MSALIDVRTMPACDMTRDCDKPISHIGEKGWVYCADHAPCRAGVERCRTLRPFELDILRGGNPLPSYAPLSKAETLARIAKPEGGGL